MIKKTSGFGDADRIGGAADDQRDLAAGQRRNVNGVVADADARDDFERRRGVELGIAERLDADRESIKPDFFAMANLAVVPVRPVGEDGFGHHVCLSDTVFNATPRTDI